MRRGLLQSVILAAALPAALIAHGRPGPLNGAAGCANLRSSGVAGFEFDNEPVAFLPITCLFLPRLPQTSESTTPVHDLLETVIPRDWEFDDGGYLTIVKDPLAPENGGLVARARFPRGWKGGRAPAWTHADISNAEVTRLYVSFRLMVSKNWQGHPVNDKLLYIWTHQKPVVFPVYVGGGDNPLRTEIRIQDVPVARNLSANLNDVAIERGKWHRWEVLLVSNVPGLPNGQVHWWVDGRKVAEYRDVTFAVPGQEDIWGAMAWRPIWGGAGGVIRDDQFMWIDDLYTSGAP